MPHDIEKINAIKQEIAHICTELTTKEMNYNYKDNINTLMTHCKNYESSTIQQIAILSLAMVYIDLLPNYIVEKHNEKDNPSQDVRKRRLYEATLLETSRQFVQICEKLAFSKKTKPSLRRSAAKAIALIYTGKPGFNLGRQLVNTVIKLACCPHQDVRELICKYISDFFKADPNGHNTLQIVTKVASTPSPEVSIELIQSLMDIKLKSFPQKTTAEKEKEKKEKITDKELLKDLREADIVTDENGPEITQTHILEQLFATVFRFLKETKSEPHFIAAMEIIKKDVIFIDRDFVAPIVSALKQSRFSLRSSITAAHTALVLCKQCEYNVDLRGFFTEVYNRAYEALDDKTALIEFMALFDIISEQIDTARTASFAKRLMIMSLHASPDIATLILVTLRKLLTPHLELTSAIDFDFEAEGDFNIYGADPDFCNGPAAKYWELAELTHHRDERVADVAKVLAGLKSSAHVRQADLNDAKQKVTWDPKKILDELDDSARVFNVNLLQFTREAFPEKAKLFELE